MAETNSHRIHLVRPPQDQDSKPQPLDAKDIAGEALTIVWECRVALSEAEEYFSMIAGELAGKLNQLELEALRSLAEKARRS